MKNPQNSDYAHQFTLKAGETLEGDCKSDLKSGLMLFNGYQKKENTRKLSKFDMTNLKVSIQK